MLSYLFEILCIPLLGPLLWILLKGKRSWIFPVPTLLLLGCLMQMAFQITSPEVWEIPMGLAGHLATVAISLKADPVTLSFAALTAFISVLIQLYSFSYLSGKQHFGFYFATLSIFTGAMCWLLLANNLFTIFLGWEVVGICSYLLVQFWFESERPLQAALRVILVNKLGDLALISFLGLLVSYGLENFVFQSLSVPQGSEVFFMSDTGTVITVFLLLAACIKSAQFPFSVWLREAMEGPTSVSALLHSATMVIAGVWVLALLSPLLGTGAQTILIVLGSITLLIGNISAVFANHFKPVLAFSTIGQLGLLMVALGLKNPEGAQLHIFTHAFFKSALFLLCGWVIHLAHVPGYHGTDAQYLPNLRAYLKQNPLLRLATLVCLASLAGVPLTAGFISKEALVPDVWNTNPTGLIWWAWVSIQVGIGLTSFYCIRLGIWLCFGSNPEIGHQKTPSLIWFPVVILAIASGFWLLGPNPLSSQGWLNTWWHRSGNMVHADVVMLLAGSILGWLSLRKNIWFLMPPNVVQQSLVNTTLQIKTIQISWLALEKISKQAIRFESQILDRGLDISSKLVVVAGHCIAFADRKILDELILLVAGIVRWLGSFLWSQSRSRPQAAMYFIGILWIALILFAVI